MTKPKNDKLMKGVTAFFSFDSSILIPIRSGFTMGVFFVYATTHQPCPCCGRANASCVTQTHTHTPTHTYKRIYIVILCLSRADCCLLACFFSVVGSHDLHVHPSRTLHLFHLVYFGTKYLTSAGSGLVPSWITRFIWALEEQSHAFESKKQRRVF